MPERRRVQPGLEGLLVPPPGHHQPGIAPVGRLEQLEALEAVLAVHRTGPGRETPCASSSPLSGATVIALIFTTVMRPILPARRTVSAILDAVELSPFRIERFYARYEHSTRFMLSSSDCESRTIGELLELEPRGARASAGDLVRVHGAAGRSRAPPGDRRAVRAGPAPTRWSSPPAPRRASVLLYHALLRPGDHVIVETPCYESALQVARSTGAEGVAVAAPARRRLGARRGCAGGADPPGDTAPLPQPAAQPHRHADDAAGVRPGDRPRPGARAGRSLRRGLPGTRARPGPTGCPPRATCTSEPSRSAASPRATGCRDCGPAGSPPATPACGTPSRR